MTYRHVSALLLGCAIATGTRPIVPINALAQETPAPRLVHGHISISGTSNIHAYTATTTAARVVQLQVAAAGGDEHDWAHTWPGPRSTYPTSCSADCSSETPA